jgi:hypothetical protein
VDGTGSGSWSLAGFGVSGVEPSGSATSELFRHSDIFIKTCCRLKGEIAKQFVD